MKAIMRAVDRFCFKHPRFGIPNLMIFIVIGNAAVFLLSMMDTTNTLYGLLVFSAADIVKGQIWRLVTFIFIPQSNNLIFVAISLYFYYFIGSTLERQWGAAKFNVYYFSGVIFNILFGLIIWIINGDNTVSYSINASYLNLSMFFAFATLYPETRVLLFFFIPIKIKWLAIVNAGFFVLSVITTSFPLNLLPIVAVLNYLVFCGEWLFDFIRPSKLKQKSQQRKRTVNFKHEADKIRREQKNREYGKKCAVCGKTDADHPNMEFRYCSRCQGIHCFCEEHISNHVHFTE